MKKMGLFKLKKIFFGVIYVDFILKKIFDKEKYNKLIDLNRKDGNGYFPLNTEDKFFIRQDKVILDQKYFLVSCRLPYF